MASHFVSISRGTEGTSQDDYTVGVASSGQVIEVRVDDAGGFRQVDMTKAMKAFERFFQDRTLWAPAGFQING